MPPVRSQPLLLSSLLYLRMLLKERWRPAFLRLSALLLS
jgi:hypothetical protein